MDFVHDIRVVDLSTGIAGPYATKLLADAGADVVKVEPPEGDPLRHRSASGADLGGKDSALFRYLNAGKRSVVGLPGDDEVLRLIQHADLVVESFSPSAIDAGELLERHPDLVVLSISPYGRTGPWSDRPASEFVVEAESGALAYHGRQNQVPYQMGGRVVEWSAGCFGAVGAVGALLRSRRTGQGEHVDCSLLLTATFTSTGMQDLLHRWLGEPPLDRPARMIEVPSVEPTADGWIGINTNMRRQFEAFLVMIERPELLDQDERWARLDFRMEHFEEWDSYVRAWTRRHTSAEILERASELRLPVAPVTDGRTVFEVEHFRSRGVFVTAPDGDFRQPRAPYVFDDQRPSPRGRAPRLGEHTGCIESWERPGRRRAAAGHSLPLEGIRVLDATGHWAGPCVGQLLGFLGADVVHLESVQRIDGFRNSVGPFVGREGWWELSWYFHTINHNKRDLTLAMTDPRGRDLARRLIAECDVMVENFSPRVYESFGLDAPAVRAINPSIIYARMPAFGLSGPWRDHVGFAQTMEQITGMAWLTGHPDDQPRIPRGPCDPVAGYHAALAILMALWRREQTGQGCSIEVPMVETALNIAAEAAIEFDAYGAVLGRNGNRSPDAAPQGLYRARGVENWVALSIVSEDHWTALKKAMGNPDWSESPDLQTFEGRRRAPDRVDDQITAWMGRQDAGATVEALVGLGVPAGVAADPREISHHPQIAALGFYEEVEHPVTGVHPVSTIPLRFASVARWTRTAAPTLGRHNHEILSDLLGLDRPEITELEVDHVIGTRPLGVGETNRVGGLPSPGLTADETVHR